jgi:Zn-dependent oligopeptidase
LIVSSQEAELEELEKGVEPTWGKLVEPLERITDRLELIWGMVQHLKAVKDSDDLRAAVEEVQVQRLNQSRIDLWSTQMRGPQRPPSIFIPDDAFHF